MAGSKFVYGFSEDPGEDALTLCGGKGVGLIRMRKPGRPLPEGFIISTDSCTRYLESGEPPEDPTDEVTDHLDEVDTRSIRENPAFLNLTVAEYPVVPSRVVDQDPDEVRPPGGEA